MKNSTLTQFFAFLFFAMLSFWANGQDLIVTHEGDSLNCKITKIKSEMIYFTFKHNDEIRNTLLPLEQVKSHQYNYYQEAAIGDIPKKKRGKVYLPLRIAVNGGWSYRFGKIPDNLNSEMRQYLRELKSGGSYGIDVSYYLSDVHGIGLKYNQYRSKNNHRNTYVTIYDGTTGNTSVSDNISINFIGAFWTTRFFDVDRKNCFIFDLGLGYMGYKDEAFAFHNFTIKGSTLGLATNVGYDIALSPKLALGAQISFLIGNLSAFDISNGKTRQTIILENGKYEDLSRMDISVGLRYRL